jgi:hypothetical protein
MVSNQEMKEGVSFKMLSIRVKLTPDLSEKLAVMPTTIWW